MEKECIFCGSVYYKKSNCSVKEWLGRKFCSYDCKKNYQVGKKTWNTGLTKETDERVAKNAESQTGIKKGPQPKLWDSAHFKNGVGFYKEESKKLGNKCKVCGSERYVETHHIDGNHNNNPQDGSNWIRICRSHHRLAHSRNLDLTDLEEIRNIRYRKMSVKNN
jgi:hypothetical protein